MSDLRGRLTSGKWLPSIKVEADEIEDGLLIPVKSMSAKLRAECIAFNDDGTEKSGADNLEFQRKIIVQTACESDGTPIFKIDDTLDGVPVITQQNLFDAALKASGMGGDDDSKN